MQRSNGNYLFSKTKSVIQTKPDIFIILFIGIASSLIAYFLAEAYDFVAAGIYISVVAFVWTIIRIIQLVVENSVIKAILIDFEHTKSTLQDLSANVDQLRNERSELLVSVAKNEKNAEDTNHQKQLVESSNKLIKLHENELINCNNTINEQKVKLNNLNSRIDLQQKAGLVEYIESMQSSVFNNMLKECFLNSKIFYIMASRAYTLLGPEIEPLNTLFGSMKKDLPIEKKDIKILLANPLFNLERTKRITEMLAESEQNKVINTFFNTIEQILEYKKHTKLKLRIYHQTASWRLIIFDDSLFLSSYKRVKRLPIFILRSGSESLYESFVYHFEKIYEVAEEIDSMENYKQLVSDSEDLLKKGECEMTLKVREIEGI